VEVSIDDLVDSEGSDAVDPATADDGPARVSSSVRGSLAWWLSFAVPISIALVAILGAVVGYRAEYHASLSGAAGNDALVSSTLASGHVYDALLTGQLAVTEHDQWERLSRAAGHGTGQGMVAATGPACAKNGPDASSVTAAEQSVDCQLAQVFSRYALPSYWTHGDPAGFDSTKFVADWVALGNLGRDVAVAEHSATAANQSRQELQLLWLALALALALAFCTLAQAALHHRWTSRTSRTSLLLAVPGWILLAGCTAILLVWEL
jgi:hypothetical protein